MNPELLLTVANGPIQVGIAAWLFARMLVPRKGFALRTALSVSVALALAMAALIACVSGSAQAGEGAFFLPWCAAFAGHIVLAAAVVYACYDTSAWMALFCGSAGYTLQNLASVVEDFAKEATGFSSLGLGLPFELAVSAVCVAAIYALCYRLFIGRLASYGITDIRDRGVLLVMLVSILVEIVFDMLNGELAKAGFLSAGVVVYQVIQATLCLFILYVEYEMLFRRHLEVDVAAMARTMEEERRHYELARDTVEAINVKCHDIRHQIRQLGGEGRVDRGFLDEVAREVSIYDAVVKTGNDPLDVILTEKSLLCEREGIALSVVADGSALGFMAPADVYSLFGNAVDNAMEAVRRLDDPSKRRIDVSVRSAGEMVAIHVENYFAGPLAFEDGLPRSTKGDAANHGFGTLSMRHVAERYGGSLAVKVQGEIFHLNVLVGRPA